VYNSTVNLDHMSVFRYTQIHYSTELLELEKLLVFFSEKNAFHVPQEAANSETHSLLQSQMHISRKCAWSCLRWNSATLVSKLFFFQKQWWVWILFRYWCIIIHINNGMSTAAQHKDCLRSNCPTRKGRCDVLSWWKKRKKRKKDNNKQEREKLTEISKRQTTDTSVIFLLLLHS